MFHLLDVTKGMTIEMIDNFLSNFNHTNLEVCALKRYDEKTLIYGRFWKQKEIGVETVLITSNSLFYERLSHECGMSSNVSYLLFSKDMHQVILKTSESIDLFHYEQQQLIPLSYQQQLQIH